MAKVFKALTEVNEHPNRCNHDLSTSVLGTYSIGKLYPVFCQPVVPGDSFLVDSAAAFNFMPLNYPTPTRMRVVFNWFYQRTKNVWPNFENYLEGLEEHEHPFIDKPASFYRTGSLADHLGVPSTLVNSNDYSVHLNNLLGLNTGVSLRSIGEYTSPDSADVEHFESNGSSSGAFISSNSYFAVNFPFDHVRFHEGDTFSFSSYLFTNGFKTYPLLLDPDYGMFTLYLSVVGRLNFDWLAESSYRLAYFIGSSPETAIDVTDVNGGFVYAERVDANYNSVNGVSDLKLTFGIPHFGEPNQDPFLSLHDNDFVYLGLSITDQEKNSIAISDATISFSGDMVRDVQDGLPCPYFQTSVNETDTVKINAIPFRVYESIYNAFYRNTQGNQPFKVDGVTQYNKYNTTTDDGSDTTDYHLFYRNWELDPYTSGLPSPQQGNAPMVGVNTLGDIEITDENGNVSTFSATADGNEVSVMSTSPAASVENARVAISMLEAGFTINDFRSTNAFQRFLEVSLRKGYRYIDFIKGHFGVAPKHSVMDMPEFLGGYSLDVNVGKVTSLAETGEGSLGDFKGEAAAFGANKHKLKHYFDDYGYLMCIMCVIPEPSYSQILPKHFLNRNRLDYYFPEFSQLGMQPITYEEVCPIQSHLAYYNGDTNKKLTDTFCYQRPNHDMVFIPNSIHGLFRTDLNDYIVNRVFAERPELGNDFLTIKPEETNSIFQYEKGHDVMVGQVAFKISAKRPVPYVVIPSLGR